MSNSLMQTKASDLEKTDQTRPDPWETRGSGEDVRVAV